MLEPLGEYQHHPRSPSKLRLAIPPLIGGFNLPSCTPTKEALNRWGCGFSSVRFICGTRAIHQQMEDGLSRFLSTDDTISYSSGFDANGGMFEMPLDAEDAVVSYELNHASIID